MNITAYCKTCKRDYELPLEIATGRGVFIQCPYCITGNPLRVKMLVLFYGAIPVTSKQAQNPPANVARWTPSVQIISAVKNLESKKGNNYE